MFKPKYFPFLHQDFFVKQYPPTLLLKMKFPYHHIHFFVAHYQNFNFCWVKLTWKSNASYGPLSNSVIKIKMMKVVVTINPENIGQVISVGKIISTGRIASYLQANILDIFIFVRYQGWNFGKGCQLWYMIHTILHI